MNVQPVFLCFLAYFVGAIPWGFILIQCFTKKDIRFLGSGNIGATNVARVGGKKLSFFTFLLDSLKGFLFVYYASYYEDVHLTIVIGYICVLAHIFSVYLKFRGGKGVATAIGVLMAWSWKIGISVVFIWILVLKITKISSVAALISIGMSTILAYIFYINNEHQLIYCIGCLGISIIIFLSHYSNIKRIIRGEEKPIIYP
jgi:glycerol-3-phosphate acyltransferase PlsY